MGMIWPGPEPHAAKSGVPLSSRSVSCLCFTLAKEPLAAEASRIREIMPIQPLVSFPDPKPAHVVGGIFLRGRVIPILDLTAKLGLPASAFAHRSYIVMRALGAGVDEFLIGFLVHRVSGVVEMKGEDIRELAQIRVKGRLRRLVNLDALITTEELSELRRLLL